MSQNEIIISSSPELTDDETRIISPLKNNTNIQMPEISSDEGELMSELADESVFLSENDTVLISSDEDFTPHKQKLTKSNIIDSMFSSDYKNVWISSKTIEEPINIEKPKDVSTCAFPEKVSNGAIQAPQHVLNIGGVEVHFPLKPYSCQIALMFKVITGINKRQNCLLESPTGTGKTLTLLCGALAWQRKERGRIAKEIEESYFSESCKPECEPAASSVSDRASPDEPFKRTLFGERSIYDSKAGTRAESSPRFKRPDASCGNENASDQVGLVTIHKRRKLNGDDTPSSSSCGTPQTTPQKTTPQKTTPQMTPQTPVTPDHSPRALENAETPKNLRLPKIYYGARTHKQIQQVVRELARTSYAGEAKMAVLSSREYSCVRDASQDQVKRSKNDACRDVISSKSRNKKTGEEETLCCFFDNRRALSRRGALPPVWDLEDLVSKGQEIGACPYFAARAIAETANIIFCPYNYLIDPGIRSSLQLDLTDDIVILDEAHNMEDVCREAASLTVTLDEIVRVANELESLARYSHGEMARHVDSLYRDLRNWEYWFQNQKPLLKESPGNSSETTHTWSGGTFATTLHAHNIGYAHYSSFADSARYLSNQMRDNSMRLFAVTSASVAMLEALATTLGYMFRDACAFIDDFKPTLVCTATSADESPASASGWRSSQFKTQSPASCLSLRLLCMNPGVVFSALESTRCVVLSSGTLTPVVSLHSELDCQFPLVLSTNHVIPEDRVWVGSLITCPDGQSLECTSKGTDRPLTQDAIGQALKWVCSKTPNGVLCFLPSYGLMNKLIKRWQETGLWSELNQIKHVFTEARNVRDHSDTMEEFYRVVGGDRGALLVAVYRGKVSEGMDFKDEQARAVVSVGIPYPNTFESMVSSKMRYNDQTVQRGRLPGREWLRVQAYRALNQALGRCVRHRADWGAVLLIDSRFQQTYYTEHLSKWIRNILGNNHHSWRSLVNSPNSLESFMQNMKIRENEEC